MNTLFTALRALSPVHVLLRKFAGNAAQSHTGPLPASWQRPTAAASSPPNFPAPCSASRSRSGGRNRVGMTPLRIVRVMEAGHRSGDGGRMRISGRMADVCAELDRMAERESSLRA